MNHHDLEHLHPPFPELGEEVEIRLETAAREGLLLFERDGELHTKPMEPWGGGLRARVPVHASPFRYVFCLPEGFWGSHGLEKTLPRYNRFFHLLAKPLSPEWALGTVFYQIFPDRFRQGRPELAPKNGAWRYGGRPIRKKAWNEPPGEDGAREFYGGDLWGVLEALPYLEALGVEALYLTPIFQSPPEAPPSTTGTRSASPSRTPTRSGGETPTAGPPSPGTRPSGTRTSSASSAAWCASRRPTPC